MKTNPQEITRRREIWKAWIAESKKLMREQIPPEDRRSKFLFQVEVEEIYPIWGEDLTSQGFTLPWGSLPDSLREYTRWIGERVSFSGYGAAGVVIGLGYDYYDYYYCIEGATGIQKFIPIRETPVILPKGTFPKLPGNAESVYLSDGTWSVRIDGRGFPFTVKIGLL